MRVKCAYEMVESRSRHAQKSAEFRSYVQREKSAFAQDALKSKARSNTRTMLRFSLGLQKLMEWKRNWDLTPEEADAILTMCDKNYISQSQLFQIFNLIQSQFDKFQTSNLSKAQALAGLRALGNMSFSTLKSATDMIDSSQDEYLRPGYFVIVFIYAWCQVNPASERTLLQ